MFVIDLKARMEMRCNFLCLLLKSLKSDEGLFSLTKQERQFPFDVLGAFLARHKVLNPLTVTKMKFHFTSSHLFKHSLQVMRIKKVIAKGKICLDISTNSPSKFTRKCIQCKEQ